MMPSPLRGGPNRRARRETDPMLPTGVSVMHMAQLERAINNARWVGAVAVVAISPFFLTIGIGYLAALPLSLIAGALIVPRLRNAYAAPIVDTGVVVLAMLVLAPDPEWPQSTIGIFVVIGAAFRFALVGPLVA